MLTTLVPHVYADRQQFSTGYLILTHTSVLYSPAALTRLVPPKTYAVGTISCRFLCCSSENLLVGNGDIPYLTGDGNISPCLLCSTNRD